MAGGFGQKPTLKGKSIKRNSSEILKDSSGADIQKNKLSGDLSPGQSVDLNKEKKPINWSREFLSASINQEQTIFINQHSQEVKREIQELKLEIKKLIQTTDNLNSEIIDIEKSIDQNIVDFSEYQLNFLTRVKFYIINYRKNISEAQIWLESFNTKKNRRNAFRNKAQNKKSGGEQYRLSGEHSASRSAN